MRLQEEKPAAKSFALNSATTYVKKPHPLEIQDFNKNHQFEENSSPKDGLNEPIDAIEQRFENEMSMLPSNHGGQISSGENYLDSNLQMSDVCQSDLNGPFKEKYDSVQNMIGNGF